MDTVRTFFRNNMRQYTMAFALVVIMVMFQLITGAFQIHIIEDGRGGIESWNFFFDWNEGIMFKPMNITNLILQNSYVLILAIGMLLCIITGNIDLSVGSVAAFVGAVAGVIMVDFHVPVLPAILICLLIGAAAGAFHGFFIAFLRIPAFIVTLAGMLIFRGFTMIILQGQTKAPFEQPFQDIAAGFIPGSDIMLGGEGGLSLVAVLTGLMVSGIFVFLQIRNRQDKIRYNFEVVPLWLDLVRMGVIVAGINFLTVSLAAYMGIPVILAILVALIILYNFFAQKTIPGRHIYALGGNEKAAKLSGIRTEQLKFWVYVNMGVLSALAGMVVAGRLNAAGPKAGTNFELDAIAACFIGGASASGGIGTVVGTIVGGLVMGVLNNGMILVGISVDWQMVIKGAVLLGAVCFDVYSKVKAGRN